jgi:hypothetical protein
MNIATHHDNSIADLTAALQVDVCQAGAPCSKSLESCIGDLPRQTPTTTEGAEISPVVGRTESEHTHASDIVQDKAQTCPLPSSRRANLNKGEHRLSQQCLLACDGRAQQLRKTPFQSLETLRADMQTFYAEASPRINSKAACLNLERHPPRRTLFASGV